MSRPLHFSSDSRHKLAHRIDLVKMDISNCEDKQARISAYVTKQKFALSRLQAELAMLPAEAASAMTCLR